MARKNRMTHWKSRKGKAFPMNGQTISCAQCGKSTTKKQTHAVEIKYGNAFNKSKEESYRKNRPTDNTAPRKRAATRVVTFVKRVCAAGCN